jgi:hypothetical protein
LLASGGWDATIRFHDTDLTSWVMRACDRATRNLRESEWKAFFSDECYRSTCSQWPSEYVDKRFACQVQGVWNNLVGK